MDGRTLYPSPMQFPRTNECTPTTYSRPSRRARTGPPLSPLQMLPPSSYTASMSACGRRRMVPPTKRRTRFCVGSTAPIGVVRP